MPRPEPLALPGRPLTLFALLALGACASGDAQDRRWQHWSCDGGAQLHWRQVATDALELRLDDAPRTYRLRQEPAASGAFYSDGELAFHSKGEQGLAYWLASDELIGRGCRPR